LQNPLLNRAATAGSKPKSLEDPTLPPRSQEIGTDLFLWLRHVMGSHLRTELNQLFPKSCQRPVLHRSRQCQPPQGIAQVVRQGKLYAKVNSCRRTGFSSKPWQDRRVQFRTYLPSLMWEMPTGGFWGHHTEFLLNKYGVPPLREGHSIDDVHFPPRSTRHMMGGWNRLFRGANRLATLRNAPYTTVSRCVARCNLAM